MPPDDPRLTDDTPCYLDCAISPDASPEAVAQLKAERIRDWREADRDQRVWMLLLADTVWAENPVKGLPSRT